VGEEALHKNRQARLREPLLLIGKGLAKKACLPPEDENVQKGPSRYFRTTQPRKTQHNELGSVVGRMGLESFPGTRKKRGRVIGRL